MDAATKQSLKQRALAEFKLYWVIVLYLWLFLGAFTVYRRLVVAETGSAYLNYGFAIIEAMVIAKVILVGRALRYSRRYEDRPLIFPVLFKCVFFAGIVVLFGLLEHAAKGLFRGEGVLGGLRALDTLGAYELGARGVMLMTALIPLFVVWEIGRVLGTHRLSAMLLTENQARGETRESD